MSYKCAHDPCGKDDGDSGGRYCEECDQYYCRYHYEIYTYGTDRSYCCSCFHNVMSVEGKIESLMAMLCDIDVESRLESLKGSKIAVYKEFVGNLKSLVDDFEFCIKEVERESKKIKVGEKIKVYKKIEVYKKIKMEKID